MTMDFQLIDRASAGLKPHRAMTNDDYQGDWRCRGAYSTATLWFLDGVLPWCTPILDRTTPEPTAGLETALAEMDADALLSDSYVDESSAAGVARAACGCPGSAECRRRAADTLLEVQ